MPRLPSAHWRNHLPPLPHLWRPIEKGLDPGVEREVTTLYHHGIETFESCQGGPGHVYPEPTVRFHGEHGEGFRALAVAMQHRFRVTALRRIWVIRDGVPSGPHWEMTFAPPMPFGGRKRRRKDGYWR